MNFLPATLKPDREILINLDEVSEIYAYNGGSIVAYTNGETTQISDTMDIVLRNLRNLDAAQINHLNSWADYYEDQLDKRRGVKLNNTIDV